MSKESKELYEFGLFRLDVTEHFLARISGERVPLSEKVFETLCVLVRNGGHLLKKDELLNQIWADSFVEENNLDKCIFSIRRALGEKPGEQKFIETVRKHGYRFVAEVRRVEVEGEKKDERYQTLKDVLGDLKDFRENLKADGKLMQVGNAAEVFPVMPIRPQTTFPWQTKRHKSFSVLILSAFVIGSMAIGFYFYNRKNTPQLVRGTTNEEANRLYLQGMYLYDKRTLADARKAIGNFEQAVRLDPNYALAWAGLAHAHRYAGNWGPADDVQEQYQKSTEAINKALALNANLSEAHSALCENKLYYEYDFAGAERACRRAVEANPNSPLAHEIYSRYLYCRGRPDEAIDEIKTAIALEPTSFFNQINYGAALYYARRYEEAAAQYKRVIETEKNSGSTVFWLITTLALQGKEAEAFEWFMKSQTSQNTSEETIHIYKTVYKQSGWQGVLREQLKRFDEGGNQSYYLRASLYAQLGNKDQAFEYLEKSFNRREVWMAYFQVDPRLDNLRDDPRFNELVKRVGLK